MGTEGAGFVTYNHLGKDPASTVRITGIVTREVVTALRYTTATGTVERPVNAREIAFMQGRSPAQAAIGAAARH